MALKSTEAEDISMANTRLPSCSPAMIWEPDTRERLVADFAALGVLAHRDGEALDRIGVRVVLVARHC